MKNTKKKSTKEVKPSKPSDSSVRKENSKVNPGGKATYFWQDANNRSLLRKCQSAVDNEGEAIKQNTSISDDKFKYNLFVRRITTHKTISQTIYRRQKRKS